MNAPPPRYIATFQSGNLRSKIRQAYHRLRNCELCPRRCGVNRLRGQRGICRTGRHAVIAAAHAHFGEEAPLVGQGGSGTIFLAHCNLLCNFCQNFEISHGGAGQALRPRQLATRMLTLQSEGCVNINFVTPSHVVPQILAATAIAIRGGLHIPIVYNSSAYDRVETLQLLDGVVDIYMPDFKFWDSEMSKKLCQAPDYPQIARKAVAEMHRQTGDMVIGVSGLAIQGLLVRHLVMPGALTETRRIMDYIAQEISPLTYVNVMPQYRPCGTIQGDSALSRGLTPEEYQQAIQGALDAGLTRIDPPRPLLRFR